MSNTRNVNVGVSEQERRKKQRDIAIKQNYRARDASCYLGIGLTTLWMYRRQGKIKAYKLSDKVTIFKKEDLDNFIARGLK